MGLTSRRKRPIDRRSRPLPHRDARLFVIATEGEETEKQYFSMFGNKRCQVKVIPSEDGRSAPHHILKQLKEYKREYQIGSGDELWLMVDVDRWRPGRLAEVAAEAGRSSFELAVSNPCFEVWLYLHHVETAIQRARALDDNPTERWPSRTGTHVYRVVEKVK